MLKSGTALQRRLGTLGLSLYGIGVIVGAGIYVLVGQIAGVSGNAVWLAFLGAAVAALPTGLSYAELASRYPHSAGEAVFANRAFGRADVSFVVGFLVLASGVVSTAALAHGFARYFCGLVHASEDAVRFTVIIAFLVILSFVNHRGIRESAWLNAVCTVASVTALLVLVAAGASHWGTVDLTQTGRPEPGAAPFTALLAGAALAFYAFIGFEDICNVAEETVEPSRVVPRAILISLAAGTALYVLVGVTAVSAVPVEQLSRSDVPMVLVSETVLPGLPSEWLGVVALLAVTNSALFNLIMASRIFYGMGRHGWIPRSFARVHPRRGTPTWGVLGAFALAATLAVTGFLRVLAEATNTIVLTVFFSINLALLVVKLRRVPPDDSSKAHFRTPIWVPGLGLVVTAWLATQFSAGAYLRAAGLALAGVALWLVQSRVTSVTR